MAGAMAIEAERHDFETRIFVNGFPKSGTHLLCLMINPIARPVPGEGMWRLPWSGNFMGNAWTEEEGRIEHAAFRLARVRAGYFIRGHMGYSEDMERFMYLLGIAHLFIYRDFRDVAVSQTFHIFNEDDNRFAHPDKKLYTDMGFDDALKAVITGVGRFSGVMDRWRHYAPWLDIDWVHSVSFEDIMANPHGETEDILRYAVNRIATIFGKEAQFDPVGLEIIVDQMVATSERRELSPTFRKGKVGSWRDHFTEEHKELFKQSDKDNWLVRLGYESDGGW